ncbi:MAG: ABC transporter ATP-binding protein [Clostridiales bacterium]|nr:ABC transporter ATP-binding protein [Clostridiales bacterium]
MIEVKNLVKRYGDHLAVDDLNFTVEDGQIYGFLGPNGAGKTTTMNIITGCLAATSGEVLIDGHDIYEEPKAAKRLIGYLPEIPPLYPDMTPYEYLLFVGELKGIPKRVLKSEVQSVMERVQITDVKNRLNKNLSKGYKQRVGIAQAMLGDPPIIILDEPTVGLDPVQIIEIREVIKSLAEGHTVIFSSHILSEVSEICTRIMIISDGKLVTEGSTEELEEKFKGGTVIDISVKGSNEAVAGVLSGLEGVESFEVTDDDGSGTVSAKIKCAEGADITEALSFALIEQRCLILKMDTEKTSLESVFVRLVGGNASDYEDAAAGYVSQSGDGETDVGPYYDEEGVSAEDLLNNAVKSVSDEHAPFDMKDDEAADEITDVDTADNDETGEKEAENDDSDL